MAKTRRQTSTVQIKREEEEHKDNQLLHSVNNTAGTHSKIRKAFKPRFSTSPLLSAQGISQEQINRLFRYVVNDKIGLYKASKKVKLGYTTASHYYNLYKNDPEKKIPLPLQMPTEDQNSYSQEQIASLIKCIVDDGMSVTAASNKVNMNYCTAGYYYKKYLKDPNRNIPKLMAFRCSQEQVNKLIACVVDGDMSVIQASKKVNMSQTTALKYYRSFLSDPNHDIPAILPKKGTRNICTQDQINTLIRSLVVDKMTLDAASKNANMCSVTGSKYYREYLKDPERRIPTASIKSDISNRDQVCTQDQIKNLISYIVDDKMTILDASRKTKMGSTTASKFYHQYLNDPNHAIPAPRRKYNPQEMKQDKINELIGYIVDDKMNIKEASKKANVSYKAGQRHYRIYVNNQKRVISTSSPPQQQDVKTKAACEKANMDPETDQQHPDGLDRGIPSHIPSHQPCTQEQIDRLISLIVDDKMNIAAASRIANMSAPTGRKYYNKYIKDPNNRAAPHIISHPPFSREKITELLDYIVKDKMRMAEAARATKVSITTAKRHYRRYISDPNNRVPAHIICNPPHPQERIDNLVCYIVEDKMTVRAAAKKAKMCEATGRKFYNRLIRDRQSPSD